MGVMNVDFCIIGGGMVGLALANQLKERYPQAVVFILEKEADIGLHSSGRNSGVLHAGIYYKPGTIKAQVCVKGAKRLKEWIEERRLPLRQCGKIVVPQRQELDYQLDLLHARGRANGARVEFISSDELKERIPCATTHSDRALWSPETAVTKPKLVVSKLKEELIARGVKIFTGLKEWRCYPDKSLIVLSDEVQINYGYVFNCAGLHAEEIAKRFELEHKFVSMPFKGIYWQLKSDCPLQIPCNLYPVPDLEVPFLGVHFTPSADDCPIVSIGPTATPALGRENYETLRGIEPNRAICNLLRLGKLLVENKGGFRKYAQDQLLLALKPVMLKEAKQLIPSIKSSYIQPSSKVGIRSQLFNLETKKLHDDFVCINHGNSIHVLNAISPAFTASFELADMIIKGTKIV